MMPAHVAQKQCKMMTFFQASQMHDEPNLICGWKQSRQLIVSSKVWGL